MNFFNFIDNAALLLVLSLLSTNIQLRWLKHEQLKNIILGVLYGLVAVIAMSIPMELQPGVFFDGRSVVLSLAGLFTGNITTLLACAIAAAARIHLGGAGVFTGVGSIVISGLAGLSFRRLVDRKTIRLNLPSLFLFGLAVHAVLVLWFFTLPREIALLVIKNVSLPYLTVFPLTTMLIGGFMEAQQQRLRMEKNLAESEKRYRYLVNTLNEGVWEAGKGLITTYVNPKMAEILGYQQPEDMIGRSVFDFIPQEEYQAVESCHARRQQSIEEHYEIELLRKDGTKVYTQLGVTPIMNDSGESIGSLAGVQDISALKLTQARLADQSRRLEELVEERTRDLKEAQAQLIKAEKLATLGELAGGVGHELRNPLAVISNATYLLKSSLPQSASNLQEYVDMIEAETHNASSIINDLLDYSRIQPTAQEPTDLSTVITRLLIKNPVPENVRLDNQISQVVPLVKANPQQLEQIFSNLITNAVEAMPEGGELKLTAKNQKDRMIISISDTGVGISRKNLSRIFEPLFTTKARGIGLGLAITARLADLNGIKIRVKSKEGQGTIFSLEFLLLT